jgi:tellurite resistance protein TehA-like permease
MPQQQASALQSLRIIYFAMLMGMLGFSAVSYFVSQTTEPSITEEETHRIFLLVCLFIATACLGISRFLWRKDIQKIQQMNVIIEKFNYYRAASIKAYALIEGAVLFAVIGFFLTHEIKFLVVAALLIASYLTYYPSSTKIANQIGENAEDLKNL